MIFLSVVSLVDGWYYGKMVELSVYFFEVVLICYRILVEIKYF